MVDFSVNKNAPEGASYFEGGQGDRLAKAMVVIGPNASGKTNLFKSFGFLDWFITSSFSFSEEVDEEMPFKQFLFSSKTQPTKLSLDFEIKGLFYRYNLELDLKRVYLEKLSTRDPETKRFKSLFKRQWNTKSNKYSFDLKGFDLPNDFSQLVRPNASVISTASYINHKESKQIINYFNNCFRTNVFESGHVSQVRVSNAVAYYDKNPEIKKIAEEILSKFDLGISRILINKRKEEEDGIPGTYTVKSFHKYIDKDEEVSLPFQYESNGTRRLYVLLKFILEVLKEGGVAVIDEIDSDLHPAVLPHLLGLFTSKESNPENAQIIFSTHNVQIINQLDKQQIVFVEKNPGEGSTSWKLSDMKVRADENFFAKYMAGSYGAVPHIKY